MNLYFIQCEEGGAVKIGWSKRPEERIVHLQIGNPHTLTLLGYGAVARTEEQRLHYVLREHCIHGEWFHPHDDVFAALEATKKAGGEYVPYPPENEKTKEGNPK